MAQLPAKAPRGRDGTLTWRKENAVYAPCIMSKLYVFTHLSGAWCSLSTPPLAIIEQDHHDQVLFHFKWLGLDSVVGWTGLGMRRSRSVGLEQVGSSATDPQLHSGVYFTFLLETGPRCSAYKRTSGHSGGRQKENMLLYLCAYYLKSGTVGQSQHRAGWLGEATPHEN
jgi:hypothetical protein